MQAVILELHTGAWDSVDVAAIGHDGLLPKLDMFMVAELYTRTEGATRTFLPGAASLPNLLARLGGAAPAAWLQQHYTKVPVALRQYADELARLLGFVGAQALGHAQGAHAACKRFGVDAVTVRTRPRQVRRHLTPRSCFGSVERAVTHTPAVQGGVPVRAALQRVVAAAAAMEGTLRSCNNLLERLHHSYFMYLQPSTTKFTTVEAYVVPPLLLIAALLLWAAHILVAPESGADGQSASVDGPQECPVEEGARLSPGRKLLGMLRRRRAQGPAISGGQQPLLLSVDLAQFERCTSAVLALHAGCAAVGACLHGVDSTASLSPVDLVLSGVSCAGLAAMLLRPWTRPESWASSCPQQTVQGRRQSSGGGAEASQIDDWRAIKALGLVTTAALMAGALFVNWCVPCLHICAVRCVLHDDTLNVHAHAPTQSPPQPLVPVLVCDSTPACFACQDASGCVCRAVAHLSLLCLAVHLLLAHRASQQRADGALAAAPRWVAWLLLHPWGLAALATGHPSVDVGGRVLGLIGPQAWLQWLRSSTVATQAFFWVAYLPAWLLPALVRLAPSPLTSA